MGAAGPERSNALCLIMLQLGSERRGRSVLSDRRCPRQFQLYQVPCSPPPLVDDCMERLMPDLVMSSGQCTEKADHGHDTLRILVE